MKRLAPRKLLGSVGVVCFDAGGANQVFSFLENNKPESLYLMLGGPAKRLINNFTFNGQLVNDLSELLNKVDTLITGTGWASDLEHSARLHAKICGKSSIAILDHWVNYRNRFIRNGTYIIPDEVWVVDEYAYKLAKLELPRVSIFQIRDYYSINQLSKISPINPSTPNQMLYLFEPMQQNWGRKLAGEFQAFNYLIDNFHALNLPSDTRIIIRPHPSDDPQKFTGFLNHKNYPQIILDQGELSNSISQSKWVAGCQTYALTLAIKSGRVAYCSLPPWAPDCQLPHKELVHLKNIL